jgi:hypothetical protein
MGGIFLNYRTVDAALGAVLLDRKLVARFGAEAVFRDHRSIEPATEFEPVLWRRLRGSDVVLAIIGPHWLAESRAGKRLIDHSGDFVRREIAEALTLDIDVLPVLIGVTELPVAADLPKDIRGLAGRQAHRVDARDPEPDIDRLVDRLATRPDLAALPPPGRGPGERQPKPGKPRKHRGISARKIEVGRDFVAGDQTNYYGGEA